MRCLQGEKSQGKPLNVSIPLQSLSVRLRAQICLPIGMTSGLGGHLLFKSVPFAAAVGGVDEKSVRDLPSNAIKIVSWIE